MRAQAVWICALALIGAASAVLPAGASTQKLLTWKYRVVLDTGHSSLDWKITSGHEAGSYGTSEMNYRGNRKGAGGTMFVHRGASSLWGGGSAGSYVIVNEKFTSTACYDGVCRDGCPKTTHRWKGHGWVDLQITRSGRVKVKWNYPSAIPCFPGEIYTDFFVPPSQSVPLKLFKRDTFELGSSGARSRGSAAEGAITWSWHLSLVRVSDDQPVAVAVASPVERGGMVTLDGSESYRRIKSYRWKVSRAAACPKDVKFEPQTLEGKKVTFPALCPFKAKLTVSDGKKTDSDTITVGVRPRSWKTPYSTVPNGVLNSRLVDGFLQLGRNVCAYDGLTGSQSSGHMLHRSAANGDYEPTGGFTVAEVTTGPFKGNFYVSVYRTKVRRAALISGDLDEGSDLYSANARAGLLSDLLALRGSVQDHEELHSALIQRQLAKSDRAKAIEAMIDSDGAALADRANVALVELETELTDATADVNVKAQMPTKWNRPATVLLRDGSGGFVSRTFPSLAQLGDDG